ncbi:MAG: transposase [Thermoplasmata archaeon]
MTFIRKIKKKSGTYLALVESKWENGKPRQHVIKYLGKEINGKPSKRVLTSNIKVKRVTRHLDVEIIDHIAGELGVKDLIPKEILVLVYAQILERPSINRMEEWLNDTDILEILGIKNISTEQLYRAIEDLVDMNFEIIEEKIYNFLKRYDTKKSFVIDITDTYFEGEKVEGEARKGKEGKVKKLIQIGLAITFDYGFPIFHKTYDGNISGKRIFRDMVTRLVSMGFEIIIMDRGFYTSKNIDEIEKLGKKMICGVVKEKSLWPVLLNIKKEDIYRKENMVKLKNTTVYIKIISYKNGKLIIVYNPHLEVIRREHYYEHSDNEEIASMLGYSLIYHNTGFDDKEVVKKYFEKDIIERAFKEMKGILNLWPVRVWLRSHIESHIKICYLGYAILAYLQYKIRDENISVIDALSKLSKGYRVELMDEEMEFKWETLVELNSIQEKIRDLVYKNS